MKPGNQNTQTLLAAQAITNTTYLFTPSFFIGGVNKLSYFLSVTDTSSSIVSCQIKFQQSLTQSGPWADFMIADISTLTASTDVPKENYITVRAWTQNLDFSGANAGSTQILGPFELTSAKLYGRLAYKIAAGTATITAELCELIV